MGGIGEIGNEKSDTEQRIHRELVVEGKRCDRQFVRREIRVDGGRHSERG